MEDVFEETCRRRDYRLKIDWVCKKCNPEDQGKRVHILMCLLDGESGKDDPNYTITETDLVHMKCQNGHITKPTRWCSKCNTKYTFADDTCLRCENIMRTIVTYERAIEDSKEQIRVCKRTKKDYSNLTENIKKFETELARLHEQ